MNTTFTSEDMFEAYLLGKGDAWEAQFWEWLEQKIKEAKNKVSP